MKYRMNILRASVIGMAIWLPFCRIDAASAGTAGLLTAHPWARNLIPLPYHAPAAGLRGMEALTGEWSPSPGWNTFLGGGGSDVGVRIAADTGGNLYVAGYGDGTWGSPVNAHSGGGYDAFVAKLDSGGGLVWNTFLGGSATDTAYGVAVDDAGSVFVSGVSDASWGSPVTAFAGSTDAFAAKLNASTGELVWSTFLGGAGFDTLYGAAAGGGGSLLLAGDSTSAWGYPVRGFTAGYDAFAARLDSDGTLVWSTFLGGSAEDYGLAIAADGAGNAYVSGASGSAWGSPVTAFTGESDAFVARLNASTGALAWNSFLGGFGVDQGASIAADGSGAVYVAGYSGASWGLPIRPHTSGMDAFLCRLNSDGWPVWNTFLGGYGSDLGMGVDADSAGHIFLAGYSSASWGDPLRAFAGVTDAFSAELDSSGSLLWSTFFGGSETDMGMDIAVVAREHIYTTGYSETSWGSPVRGYSAGSDAIVAEMENPLPLAFGKSAPADGTYATTAPTLSWEDSGGAETYYYCIDTVDNGSCDTAWTETGSTAGAALSGLGNNVTYSWAVVAYNGAGFRYADGGTWWSFTARNPTFADVPVNHALWEYIESFYASGITGGCGVSPLIYCPENNVTRAAMAVFLLRAKYGPSYTPPAARHFFSDLPVAGKEWQEAWVDQFYAEGITGGCGTGPLIYCPENPVTRAAMAVFILRALEGSSYTPPAASHFFADLPVAGKEWMEPWVDELYRRGITTGCGTGPLIYCPEDPVKRQAMAAFIVRAFDLPLP